MRNKAPLIVDTEKKERIEWDKLCFLAQLMIEVSDNLRGSRYDAQKMKNHLNGVIKEAEKKVKEHFDVYENSVPGAIVEELNGRDVYYELIRAYAFIFNKLPHEVLSIAKTIEILEERGIDYTEVYFEPKKAID